MVFRCSRVGEVIEWGDMARLSIPIWRKMTYAAVTVAAVFLAAKGACRLVLSDRQLRISQVDPKGHHHHSVGAFLAVEMSKVDRPHFPHLIPSAVIRAPPGTPGTFNNDPGRQEVRHVPPRDIPAGPRRVLVFGGSAAFGVDVEYSKIFSTLLQQQGRAALGDPTFEVLNMGRTGWELNSVIPKIQQVVAAMPRPEAVIIYAGNNEVLSVASDLDFICPDPWEKVYLYRAFLRAMTSARLDKHLSGHDRLHSVDGGPITKKFMARQLWRPCGTFQDASFWPRLKKAYVQQHRKNLVHISDWLQLKQILVVLVAPPINLVYFPGSIQKQPVTQRAVGRSTYRDLTARLYGILRMDSRKKELLDFVAREPTGAIQWYALGMEMEMEKRFAEAARCFRRARRAQFGVLAGLPSFADTVKSLEAPGVLVVRTDDWFPADRAPHMQAGELFMDAMHANPAGHARLARAIGARLFPELKRR